MKKDPFIKEALEKMIVALTPILDSEAKRTSLKASPNRRDYYDLTMPFCDTTTFSREYLTERLKSVDSIKKFYAEERHCAALDHAGFLS